MALFQFWARPSAAQNSVRVVLKAPWNTPLKDSLYACSAQCQSLKPIGNLTYAADILIPETAKDIPLIFHRGSLATQAVDSSGQILGPTWVHGQAPPFVLSVVNWKDLPSLGISGDVRIFRDVFSPQLNNVRNISVWLPPDYETSGLRYPVVYMHDGQNVFDPRTSTTGIDWRVDDIMQTKVSNGKLPAAIVVAVDCIRTARYDEYDYTIRGNLYARFLIDTVKPLIDQNFRTKVGRESTFTMGSSMGGLISLSLLWKHADIFSRAAGLSLAVHIHNGSIYQVINSSPKPWAPISFYMDHGGYNDDAAYESANKPFALFLASKGFLIDPVNFSYVIDPYGDHREVDWARRSASVLEWLLRD